VNFNPLPLDITRDIISRETDINTESASFLAEFSEGSPGRAIDMIEDEVMERKEELADLVLNAPVWDREDAAGLEQDLELLLLFLRNAAVKKDAPEVFLSYSIETIYEKMSKLISLKRALEGNANPKLVAPILAREFQGS